jgi:hypothetical protein
MVVLASSLIILLFCALIVAWLQPSKGCLAGLLRPVAGLAGAVIPLVLAWLWKRPVDPPGYAALVAAFIFNISAVALAATGWQSVLKGRSGEIEETMVDSLVNPFSAMSQPTGSATSADDVLGGCVLALLMMVLNVAIVIGLLIANVLKKLLPVPGNLWRRAARVVLSFAYALAVYGGGAALITLAG